MTNFREALAQIKTTVDIADYIVRSGVKLDPSGPSKFKGLCPFHGERTPSFYVDTQFQNYKCFGCGVTGDVLSYVQYTENLDFSDVVRKLAEENNIEIKLSDQEQSIDYKSLRECIKEAAIFFAKNFKKLEESHPAKQQVLERGLSLDSMTYGYALEARRSLYSHLKEKGYSDEIIAGTGVCRAFESDPKKLFDFWNGRLMFVITDATGKPVGFSGRKLFKDDKRGKYVNSVDGPLFDKSSVLFHHSKAKKLANEQGVIFVAEGQFDVAAIATAGYENVVASSGTAFTKKQALMCSRMVGENGKVVFCFDGDVAGQKAALKVFSTAPEIQPQAYVVPVPEGLDPCDYRQTNGNESLRNLLDSKITLIDFVLSVTAKKYDTNDETQIARYITEASSILKTISNKTLLSLYSKKVAIESGLSMDEVASEVEAARRLDSEQLDSLDENTDNSSLSASQQLQERLDVSDSEEILIEKVEASNLYDLYARILMLAFYDRRFFKALSNSDTLPKEFRKIAEQGASIPPESRLIPELFEEPVFIAYLMEKNYFPYMDLMDNKEIKELFLTLREEIIIQVEDLTQRKYAKRIIMTFEDDRGNDIEVLQAAIKREPKASKKEGNV